VVVRLQSRPKAARASSGGEVVRYSAGRAVLEMGSILASDHLDRPITVALLRDSASDRYFKTRSTMDSIFDKWTTSLQAIGATVRVVPIARAAEAKTANVIVIPDQRCLGKAARDLVASAPSRGQGVLATSLSGTNDGNCEWVGFNFITSVSGAERADTLEHRRVLYLTVPAQGPLGARIPPGARIEIQPDPHIALRDPHRDAYYSDYGLNPDPASGQPLLDGAIVHSTKGGGRSVYWGFDLMRVEKRPWDREISSLLLRNSIAWAAGQPLAEIEPWPNRKTVAAVIAQDVEDEFANARFAFDTLRAAGVRGTYFLVSDLAQQNSALAKEIATDGEIGTHSENHHLLGGTDPAQQASRLAKTQHDLTTLIGHSVRGLRPPEEQFDSTTLSSWARAGGGYVFGANNARAASPEIIAVDQGPMVLLGRVINDDFVSVRRAGRTDPDVLTVEYLRAFAKVKALGGLYVLSYHSQMLSREQSVAALGMIGRAIKRDSAAWVTTAGDVADWWRARAAVRLVAQHEARDRVVVELDNDNARALDGAILRVVLPGGSPNVSSVDGATLVANDGEEARLALGRLQPHEHRVVTLSVGAGEVARAR
jgi:peptidoglycan/xylan/chitin deacetylase (PgdA/CDA1 family)